MYSCSAGTIFRWDRYIRVLMNSYFTERSIAARKAVYDVEVKARKVILETFLLAITVSGDRSDMGVLGRFQGTPLASWPNSVVKDDKADHPVSI